MAETKVLNRKEYGPGTYIFREGQEGDVAYVVQTGSVDIVKEIEGEEKILGTVGKGGIFGEMALIDNKPRMAGARVAEATTVIVVNRQMMEEKLKKSDPFVRGLLHIFGDTIRRLSQG